MSEIGQLIITRQADGSVTFDWQGGLYLVISQELMHDADQTTIKRDGDNLTIGPYQLRLIGRDPQGDYVAERLTPIPASTDQAAQGQG